MAALPSAAEEQAFMDALLANLSPDDLFAPPSSPNTRPDSPSPPSPTTTGVSRVPSSSNPARQTAQEAVSKQELFDALLDGVAFDDFDDWASLPPTPRKTTKSAALSRPPLLNLRPPAPLPPPSWSPRTWVRCKVLAVPLDQLDPRGFGRKELECTILASGGWKEGEELLKGVEGRRIKVELTDEWGETAVQAGDIVNLISPDLPTLLKPLVQTPYSPSPLTPPPPPPQSPVLRLSSSPKNAATLLVLEPDTLVPSTSLAASLSCARRAVLRTLVRSSTGDVGKALLYGNVLHTTFQTLLERAVQSGGSFKEGDISRAVSQALGDDDAGGGGGEGDKVKGDVWRAGLDWVDVKREVQEKAQGGFGAFGERFVEESSKDGANGKQDQPDNLLASSSTPSERLTVVGLHAIEEDLRSPLFGLQGKVDVSLQVKLDSPSTGGGEGGKGGKEWAVPFEIKTGRTVGQMEHRAQTSVYCLLMEERYGTPVPAGLLYYTQPGAVHKITTSPLDVRALIQRRNTLASWLGKKSKASLPRQTTVEVVQEDAVEEDSGVEEEGRRLPETMDRSYDCSRCYQVDVCMLYRKAVEQVEDDSSPIAELYEKKTDHLTVAHTTFFKKWEALVSMEEQGATRLAKEIWTMGAEDRQKQGRCFANMVVQSAAPATGPQTARIHKFTYRFARWIDPARTRPSTMFIANQSLLSGHISPGDPIAVSLEPGLVSLARGFVLDLRAEWVSVGLDTELDERVLVERLSRKSKVKDGQPLQFRIDKDELATGMGRIRDNLTQLFLPSASEILRSLIVDLSPPHFDNALAPRQEDLPAHLNPDQQKAVTTVLTAKDYALILGMPGTGKTSTVVEVVRALVRQGKSVLLTSYTHSAVDTIVVKLAEAGGVDILRLGNPDKVNPAVQKFTLGAMAPASSMEEYEARLMRPQVVATTALTIDHPLFSKRQFDVCIVDEASQITLPVCLGPLRFAKTFVLVGDHFQLPPLVKNAAARKGGLETSLFRLLHEAHPEASVSLAHQYRMNEDIMSLTNSLFYSGGLRCGSERVAKQVLDVPKVEEVKAGLNSDDDVWERKGERAWLQKVLDPECRTVFLNTDVADLRESRVGDLVQNVGEAHVVQVVTQALLRSGVAPSQLAAITLYRQQIKLLQHTFEAKGVEGIEIITADKSQGRDKDCVIVSMVRSNAHGSVGELLRDWRRINVAFTRAKAKLVIVGSHSTLAADPLLARFLALMATNAWTIDLPSHVGSQHAHLAALRDIKLEAEELAVATLESRSTYNSRASTGTTTTALSTPTRRKRATTTVKREEEGVNENLSATLTQKRRTPKKARLSEEAIVKGRPMLRDVLAELK